FEDVARRQLRAAADVAEVDLLAGELIDRGDAGVGTHHEVHLLVEQLGDVDDLVVDQANLVGAAEGVEQVGLRDAKIDAFEKADILDVLSAALADDRQNAKLICIVEDGG